MFLERLFFGFGFGFFFGREIVGGHGARCFMGKYSSGYISFLPLIYRRWFFVLRCTSGDLGYGV